MPLIVGLFLISAVILEPRPALRDLAEAGLYYLLVFGLPIAAGIFCWRRALRAEERDIAPPAHAPAYVIEGSGLVQVSEAEIVELLHRRAGNPTRIIATDGEPMLVRDVVRVAGPLLLPTDEHYHYAERGGIPLSADDGRYFFYSNEIARIEDMPSGTAILIR